MKLKSIPLLLLLAALMLLLAGCGGAAAPMPAYTPLPTYTPSPTLTTQVIIKEAVITATAMPTATHAPSSALDSAMKEALLALANNRDAWFLASDITTMALEGLYDSWSVICRNETSLADYKVVVYAFIRPAVLDGLEMELKDAQKAERYYKVISWSAPWAYVEQTWKISQKIVLGPERQLYVLESGSWRYHDC